TERALACDCPIVQIVSILFLLSNFIKNRDDTTERALACDCPIVQIVSILFLLSNFIKNRDDTI
ncbi:MAG: hypothetical protein PHC64_01975, partial [Candidatus Gastranaerophilales bacterium]|nr:hypothetical protein [Candidatus Gastranaerophilales bacterium]